MTTDVKTETIKDISEVSYKIKKMFSCEIKEVLKQMDSKTKKMINYGYIAVAKSNNMSRQEKAEFYLSYARAYIN